MSLTGIAMHELAAPAWSANLAWAWASAFAGTALAAVVATASGVR